MYIPDRPLEKNEVYDYPFDRIETARSIDPKQLAGSKIVASREEYVKSLPENLNFMEIGVAWGYYSNIVCATKHPNKTVLIDPFDNDLKCWSWRKTGECQCDQKHERLYTQETHVQWITDEFAKYPNTIIIQGEAPKDLPEEKDFDYIYIDTYNERQHTRLLANTASKLVKVGGILGFNDYTIYDGMIEDIPYGTYQTVNEFLYFNPNWSVDAIALHPMGFYDIYIRRNA